jgi:CTP:molybdopterin cytidylyltransferase MocA
MAGPVVRLAGPVVRLAGPVVRLAGPVVRLAGSLVRLGRFAGRASWLAGRFGGAARPVCSSGELVGRSGRLVRWSRRIWPYRPSPGIVAVSCGSREREPHASLGPGAQFTRSPRCPERYRGADQVPSSGPAAVIILAAGEGTRMRSRIPKMLHKVCGEAMLGHVLAAARALRPDRLIVVVGEASGPVARYVGAHAPEAQTVVQERRGGTGHAVRTVLETVGVIHGTVVVTYADTPLLRGETLAGLVRAQESGESAVTALTALAPDPTGYGRILRDHSGGFAGIVEQADASAAQQAVDEINSGMYAFDGDLLADAVKRIPSDNATGEEYLTDVLGILAGDGYRVGIAACPDFDEVQGVNDRAQLARARRVLSRRNAATGRVPG